MTVTTAGVVVGSLDGPGMIAQTGLLATAPVGDSTFVMWTGGAADGRTALQVRNDRGDLVATVGHLGAGPGEVSRVTALARGCEGEIVVGDGNRVVSFDQDGESQGTWTLPFNSFIAGVVCADRGAFALSARRSVPGGEAEFLHEFRPADQTLTAVPNRIAADSSEADDWWRQLDRTRNGGFVAVSRDYRIEVLDADLRVVGRLMRRPEGWPEDVAGFNAERQEGGIARPQFRSIDATVDTDGMLWVASHIPEANWEDELVPHERYPQLRVPGGVDAGHDTLVEVIDLQSAKVVRSFILDGRVRSFALPGRVLIYRGDVPFPSFRMVDLRGVRP